MLQISLSSGPTSHISSHCTFLCVLFGSQEFIFGFAYHYYELASGLLCYYSSLAERNWWYELQWFLCSLKLKLNIDYFAHLLNRLNGKSFRLQAICLCWKFVMEKDPIGCHNLFIGWQESKCVLKHPKPAIKSKMFSLQDCNSSRPNVIGSLSLPIFNLGAKHFIPLSRGVCFSTWSWKPWWTFRESLLIPISLIHIRGILGNINCCYHFVPQLETGTCIETHLVIEVFTVLASWDQLVAVSINSCPVKVLLHWMFHSWLP